MTKYTNRQLLVILKMQIIVTPAITARNETVITFTTGRNMGKKGGNVNCCRHLENPSGSVY